VRAFTSDGWFKTGDLATIRGGRVTVTGREKDVIIVNSVNYYSHAIESVVDAIDGVEPSFTAAVAGAPRHRHRQPRHLLRAALGRPGDAGRAPAAHPRRGGARHRRHREYLVPVAPADVPKTSLGKIQRTELARELIAGGFDDRLKIVAALLGTMTWCRPWFFRRVWRAKGAGPGAGSLDGQRVVAVRARRPSGEACAASCRARRLGCFGCAGDCLRAPRRRPLRDAPTNSSDHAALVSALSSEAPIQRLVHAWSASSPGAEGDELLATGAVSVLLLVQAVARTQPRAAVTLTCVARHTHRVMTSDEIVPARSALAAIVASAPQELDWLRARHVDVASHDAADAARLVADEHAAAGSDRDVAYRDGRRFVWGLERASLAAASWHDIPLVRGGCYLVTGGAGGVAGHVVELLRETAEARVLLIGRRPLERAASPALQRLLADGDVAYAVADVCDEEALSNAVATYERLCGRRLDGVVHLAGSYHEAAIATESADALLATIRPKLAGTINVHKLLAARGGGVLICRILGRGHLRRRQHRQLRRGQRLSDRLRAAARRPRRRPAVLHGVEHLGRHRPQPRLSVGPAAVTRLPADVARARPRQSARGARRGAGHARGRTRRRASQRAPVSRRPDARARRAVPRRRRAGRGRAGDDGRGDPRPVRAALDGDGDLRAAACRGCRPARVDRAQLAATGGKAAPRPRQAPRSEAERALAEVWRRVLNASEIDVDDNFFDHGGDSLTALRLTGALRETLGRGAAAARGVRGLDVCRARAGDRGRASGGAAGGTVGSRGRRAALGGQRALWLLHALAPASAALNIGFTARAARPRGFHRARARVAGARRSSPDAAHRVSRRRRRAGPPRASPARPCRIAVENASGGATTRYSPPSRRRSTARSISPRSGGARAPLAARGPDAFLAATFHHIAIDGGSLWLCLSELGELTTAPVEARSRLSTRTPGSSATCSGRRG
jgi:hypothetical protein